MKPKASPLIPDENDSRLWVRVSGNLVLHRPSGMYYVRKSKAGKGRIFQTTGFDQKGKAQSKADEMISEWLFGKRATTGRAQTVEQAVDFLAIELEQEFLNKHRKPGTASKDKVYLKQVKEYFGEYHLTEIDEDFCKNWARTDGARLNKTLFDLFKYLSKVMTFSYEQKWITRKPKIKNPDKKKRKVEPHIYAPTELQKIAEKCDLEMLTQLTLAADCGNRTGEVRTLEISMIEFQKHEGEAVAVIKFPEDKAGAMRGEGREFMTSPRVAKLLKRWLKERPVHSDKYVFPSPTDPTKPQTKVYQNRKWRKACDAAKIGGRAWFYDLRHTFYTTALLQAREPVQHVSEFGGTSIATLQKRYLHSDAKKTASVSKAVRMDFGVKENEEE